MLGLRGSFLGFTYNGIHSSLLGITRTSQGMDQTSIQPSFQDNKIQIPGSDGSYYYGSTFTQRNFQVNFAFDKITENQLRAIQQLLSTKGLHQLIFDESLYKVYMAKVTGSAILKHIPFFIDGKRLYSGTGAITFTCPDPFARSRYEYLEDFSAHSVLEWATDEDLEFFTNNLIPDVAKIDYTEKGQSAPEGGAGIYMSESDYLDFFSDSAFESCNIVVDLFGELQIGATPDYAYVNINEWAEASKIPSNLDYGSYTKVQDNQWECELYNAGDFDMYVEFLFPAVSTPTTISIIHNGHEVRLNNFVSSNSDQYFGINMKEFSVQGYDANLKETKNYYNGFLDKRQFFTLPVGKNKITVTGLRPVKNRFKYLYL